jgi:hypothetical protein
VGWGTKNHERLDNKSLSKTSLGGGGKFPKEPKRISSPKGEGAGEGDKRGLPDHLIPYLTKSWESLVFSKGVAIRVEVDWMTCSEAFSFQIGDGEC